MDFSLQKSALPVILTFMLPEPVKATMTNVAENTQNVIHSTRWTINVDAAAEKHTTLRSWNAVLTDSCALLARVKLVPAFTETVRHLAGASVEPVITDTFAMNGHAQ